MFMVLTSWGGADYDPEEDYAGWRGPLDEAIRFAKWLLERPTARFLPGYTITVVEVGV